MTKRNLFPHIIIFSLCIGTLTASRAQPLAPALDHILAAPALRGGITGAVVVRVRDGRTLYAHSSELRLMPASNRKLFTAASALGVLGDDFKYRTSVSITTSVGRGISNYGSVFGDIYLTGSGDSALTTADIDDLAAQVYRCGIRYIMGTVVGDGSLFTDGPYGFGWEWDDFSDEEFPKISALEVNHGDVTVNITANSVMGSAALVTLDPPGPEVNLQGTVPTYAASDLPCTVVRPFGTDILLLGGSIARGKTFTQNVPVDNPSFYTTELFRTELLKAGVSVQGSGRIGSKPPPNSPGMTGQGYYNSKATSPWPTALAVHTSVPLTQYLPLMMKPSDNLIAESLVRTIGAVKGKGGSYDEGYLLETRFFRSLGVTVGDIDLRDGSGVSRRNYVTARAIGQLLIGMAKRPDFKAYYDSLPIAGVDGTLKNRFLNTPAAGNVHAKTGTLSQARALSGYLTAKDGKLYAFSLIMNNFPGNAKSAGDVQDQFVEYLIKHL